MKSTVYNFVGTTGRKCLGSVPLELLAGCSHRFFSGAMRKPLKIGVPILSYPKGKERQEGDLAA